MNVNPEHVVLNYVKTKKYCSRDNFNNKIKSTFCGYQSCELKSYYQFKLNQFIENIAKRNIIILCQIKIIIYIFCNIYI